MIKKNLSLFVAAVAAEFLDVNLRNKYFKYVNLELHGKSRI